jgi:hypothetical protein
MNNQTIKNELKKKYPNQVVNYVVVKKYATRTGHILSLFHDPSLIKMIKWAKEQVAAIKLLHPDWTIQYEMERITPYNQHIELWGSDKRQARSTIQEDVGH